MVDCLGRWLVERLHLVVGTKVGRLTVGWWMMITLLTRGAAGAFNPLSQNGPARVEIEISTRQFLSFCVLFEGSGADIWTREENIINTSANLQKQKNFRVLELK